MDGPDEIRKNNKAMSRRILSAGFAIFFRNVDPDPVLFDW